LEWFTYSHIARKDWNAVETLFPYEWDYKFDWGCRRGIQRRQEPLRFLWYGRGAMPWDLLGTSVDGVELMSDRFLDALRDAGVRGLDTVPAVVRLKDETVFAYHMIVTPNEVSRIRFRRHEPLFGDYHRLLDPVVDGLDENLSDFWIGPMDENDQTHICSLRVKDIAKANKFTNISFEPISLLASDRIEYREWLCD
jgi:hypothetical protein